MATCLIIQHVEPEGPYTIGEALSSAGVDVEVVRIHLGEALPDQIADYDGLVVMGGPMSAASDEGFPTRRGELALLSDAIDLELPTLGVCLGAQLLAAATGAPVIPGNRGPEIGWAPIELSTEAAGDLLLAGAPSELTVLHWHSDTYELPAKAVHLAANSVYEQQAFRVGSCAWGLQFHLEVDESAVEAFLAAFEADAASAGTSGEAIRDATSPALSILMPIRETVLNRFATLVATGFDE